MQNLKGKSKVISSCLAGALALAGCGTASGSADGGCISGAIEIVFSPMYSATDGMHKFQIPAIVNGVEASLVKWSASDNSMVSLAADPISGGTMITVLKPGTVTITAQAGDLCGSSTLTIDSATPDDWNAGDQRYNNGVDLHPPDAGMGPPGGGDGGFGGHRDGGFLPTDLACTNCHGPTANSIFKDVAHTPEQIGGFSDQDLDDIIRTGTVPDGGYFDPAIVQYQQWHNFHQWTMTNEELKGVIVYLRSLTPTPQTGAANFGGHGGFGGHRDGG